MHVELQEADGVVRGLGYYVSKPVLLVDLLLRSYCDNGLHF